MDGAQEELAHAAALPRAQDAACAFSLIERRTTQAQHRRPAAQALDVGHTQLGC